MRCSAIAPAAAIAVLSLALDSASHTLSGTVTDVNGTPVANAAVWLSIARDARVATAGQNGRFDFAEVPTGRVDLVAFKDGLAAGGATGQCIADIDVKIVLPPAVPTRLRIVNRLHEPLEGARLRRLELPGDFAVYVEDLLPLGFPSPPSDAEGFLILPPLPRDALVGITIGHPRYADGVNFALPTGEDLDFLLPEGIPLAGRVADAAGSGISRARISVYRTRDDGPQLVTELLSGEDGFFAAMAPPGPYWITAKHPRFAMPAPFPVENRLGESTIANLTMPDGRRLQGRALGAGDVPVPLAVFAYRVENYIVDEAVSDAAGRFTLVVPPGTGVLQVRAPRRMSPVQGPRVPVTIGGALDTVLPPIRFEAAPTLHGRVTLPDDSPGEKVVIHSLNLNPPIVALTNEQGEFSVELEATPEGPATFRAEHAFRFLRRDFEIDPSKSLAKEVQLREYEPSPAAIAPEWGNNLQPLLNKPAPELAIRAWFNLPAGSDGLRLSELKNKVIVLLFWAGFDQSGRNREQLEELKALHALYKDLEDIAIVSVHDGAVAPDAAAAYARDLGLGFPVGVDLASSDSFSRYRTNYVPQVVLIDKKGAVRFYQTDGKLIEFVKLLRRE